MRLGGTPRGIRKDILAVIRAAPPLLTGAGVKLEVAPLLFLYFTKR